MGEPKTEREHVGFFARIGRSLNWISRHLSDYARENPGFTLFLQIGVLATPTVGALVGLAGLEGRPKAVLVSLVTLGTTFLALLGILTARGTAEVAKSADQLWKDGYYEGITHWRRQAGMRAGALRQLFRQINSMLILRGGGRPASATTAGPVRGDDAVRSFLTAITTAVVIHFDLDPAHVNANLMVTVRPRPKQPEDLELRLVQFAIENHARSQNNRRLKIDRENPKAGAVAAYCTTEPQYIPDTREVPEIPAGRPYRSILSWPVVCDSACDVLGVVNVDSTEALAFGDLDEVGEAGRMGAMELCSDALQGIGIALLDPKCFPCDGTRI